MKNGRFLTTLAGCFLGLGLMAQASVIYINSAPGLLTNVAGHPLTVATGAHPLWQQNNPVNPGDPGNSGAVWISYADTGYQGSFFQPHLGTSPAMSVFYNFVSGAGALDLKVWADDSADVLLDGNYLTHAAFTQSICSGQPIGCRPQDAGVFLNIPLLAGAHKLTFTAYQVGTGGDTSSNPFGLLFTGTAPGASLVVSGVPEPGTIAMFGAGLVALGFYRRKRK